MSDRESIEHDVYIDNLCYKNAFSSAINESALEQCIYLFVEGHSEELAFRILLEEALGLKFKEYGIVIANYNGIGNLKNTVRLMSKTLSFARPMIFTFDDDDKSKVPEIASLPPNIHLFKIPIDPKVKLSSRHFGGSFEESFDSNCFINACFNTHLLKNHQHLKKIFSASFVEDRPYYNQIKLFLKSRKFPNFYPSKIEIAEEMAVHCGSVPLTYIKLFELIKKIRTMHPVKVKM